MCHSPRIRDFRLPSAISTVAAASFFCAVLTLSALSPANASSITPDGLLLVEGERMFPVGLLELGTYAFPDWQQKIQDSGANLVWDVEIAYADTTPTCDEVIQAAHDGDYYLMLGSGDTWNWDDQATPEMEVDRMMYEVQGLADLVDCVSAHPERVVAWANRDEPVWTVSRSQIGDIDEAHIRNTYYQLHTRLTDPIVTMNFAPAHLSQDLDTWKADVASYASATDVMMFAAYPYPAGVGTCGEFNVIGYPDCVMDRLVVGADIFLSELNNPGQPLWMIIQGFKGIPLKEARWEAYASIVHGATGILWAGWSWYHWLGTGEETWPVTEQVMSEVSELQRYLVGNDFSGVFSDHPDVEVRGLESNDKVVVIAISRNGYTGPATIHLPGLQRTRVQVLNEGRHLNAVDEMIVDTFDGYEAHVYRYNVLKGAGGPGTAVSAPLGEGEVPREFLVEAFPNPSIGRTTVRFELPQAASALFTVYDAAGRQVAVIGRGSYPAGTAEMYWNGRDLSGKPVAAGTYFVRGQTSSGATETARVMILR